MSYDPDFQRMFSDPEGFDEEWRFPDEVPDFLCEWCLQYDTILYPEPFTGNNYQVCKRCYEVLKTAYES